MPEIQPTERGEMGYDISGLPIHIAARYDHRSRLYLDHDDLTVIFYRPLQKITETEWLIDVNGRVYVADEAMLEDGLEAMEEVNP